MKHEEEKSIAYEDTLCEFCSNKFSTKQKRQLHEGTKCLNEGNLNSSSESEAESDSENELNLNKLLLKIPPISWIDPEIGSDIESNYVESEIKCDICNKEFSSEQQYSNHKYTHSERLQCPECPLTFTRNNRRTDHIVNVHKRTVDKIDYEYAQVTERKTYQCRHCGYETTSRRNYVVHKKFIHKRPEQEQFYCDQCTYKTVRQGDLNKHIDEIHEKSSKKLLCCDKCSYKTVRQGHLNQHHKTVHSSVLEIKCTQCSFVATGKSELNSHIRSVHSIGKFKCDKCDFSDNQNKRLTQHIKRKHQFDALNCDQCDFRSILKDELAFHFDTVHKNKRAKFQCEKCNFSCDEHERIRDHIDNQHTIL